MGFNSGFKGLRVYGKLTAQDALWTPHMGDASLCLSKSKSRSWAL